MSIEQLRNKYEALAPFLDERLRVANLPLEPQKVKATNALSGAEKEVQITLFRKAGEVAGTQRGI